MRLGIRRVTAIDALIVFQAESFVWLRRSPLKVLEAKGLGQADCMRSGAMRRRCERFFPRAAERG